MKQISSSNSNNNNNNKIKDHKPSSFSSLLSPSSSTTTNNINNLRTSTQSSVSTHHTSLSSSNYHLLEENMSPPNINNNTTNNNNNSSNNNNMINGGSGDDPLLMMQMLQQYIQMNGNNQGVNGNNNNNNNSSLTSSSSSAMNNNNGVPPAAVDPMMMMKMLQMFSGAGGIQQQPHVSNMLLTPPPPSNSLPITNSSRESSRLNNRSSSPTRSPSPPPRPSSPTVFQHEDDMSGVPPDILAQKYNLVEKKKRKMRCGKKRGPQEEFIFHLKLEQDKKKKRRSAQAAQAAAANASASNSGTTATATATNSLTTTAPPTTTTTALPASSSSSSAVPPTGTTTTTATTTNGNNTKESGKQSAASIPSTTTNSKASSSTTPPTSYPPPPPSSLQKKTSSSSIGGTELKTKQRKTTKKLQEAASGRSKVSSSEDIPELAAQSSATNHPILPPTTQPSSLPLPMSTSNPSLSSIPISMPTNFINNIPSDITSLLMPKLTPSTDNFLLGGGVGGSEEIESWQDIPQFSNNAAQQLHGEFSAPYPTLQQKPKGCYYGDKSRGKKVQKVPISQSSSRLQIINNRRKTSIIGSIIDILSDDTSITNHTIPSMVTLLDGFVVKVNEAMKDMLGFDSVNDIEFRSNLQNYLHPQDIIKHDILLLQMLSTNSDSCKHSLKFVNRNGKCAPLSTEFCCIRNEMGLPQWIVIRLSNPNMKLTNIEENHTDIIHVSQMNRTVSDYDMNHTSREALINDSPQNFQDMFLKILERLFGSKQPTCFYDKMGYILWNNERFDTLFNNPRKTFFGRRVYDIPEMKGTIMEILSNSVLVDFPDKLEAQMSPDEHSMMNSSQIYDSRLKMNCYGQKVTENNGTVFGYVWMFSVIREETVETPSHSHVENYNVNQEEDMFENGDFFQ